MSDAWYEGVPDETLKSETDKAYEQAEAAVRRGLAAGLDFDAACSAVEAQDESLKAVIIDDILKMIIAEEHFTKKVPLAELAGRLKIAIERLEAAKESMLREVEESAVREFNGNFPKGSA
ncbi:MAG: hypothetical protein M0Z79_10290 [Nitrospiraceae bacterium]|nr:hypothetical protein [Nitrospiraceae bacterium]